MQHYGILQCVGVRSGSRARTDIPQWLAVTADKPWLLLVESLLHLFNVITNRAKWSAVNIAPWIIAVFLCWEAEALNDKHYYKQLLTCVSGFIWVLITLNLDGTVKRIFFCFQLVAALFLQIYVVIMEVIWMQFWIAACLMIIIWTLDQSHLDFWF